MRLFWAFAIVLVVISLIQPGPLQLVPGLQNPFGFGPDLRGDRPIAPIFALSMVIIFPCLGISMVSRYRSAGRVERLQLKWFVLALGVSVIGLGIVMTEAVVLDRPADVIGLTVFVFAGAVVPVAIGIAILRHNLYDIDRIVSRTLGYGVVTGVLAALFAATAISLSTLLGSFGEGSTLAVAASTLLVFALFGPLRQRAQTIVDRRFDRSHYDASRTIGNLTQRLRDDVDLRRLETDVLGVIEDTFHPAGASVWLRSRESSRTTTDTIQGISSVTIPGRQVAKVTTS